MKKRQRHNHQIQKRWNRTNEIDHILKIFPAQHQQLVPKWNTLNMQQQPQLTPNSIYGMPFNHPAPKSPTHIKHHNGRKGVEFESSPHDPGMSDPRANDHARLHNLGVPYGRSRYRPVYFQGAYKGHYLHGRHQRKQHRAPFSLNRARNAISRIFFNNGDGGSSSAYGMFSLEKVQ